jgi:general secretion pathway protein K
LTRSPKPGERGAALLTVLLLVAVISVLAASALEKLNMSTKMAENGVALQQARAFAYAAETMAMIRVNAIVTADAARTTLDGDWEGRPQPLPIPGGVATLTITDGGNCFNLNGLVDDRIPKNYIAQPTQMAEFARLMTLIGIPGDQATGIAAATADYIDSNSTPEAGGAEDGAYTAKGQPYRTANSLMTDPSEIRAVMGVTSDVYARLRPWICTLPVDRPTSINVNTLQPEQAPLFAMLFASGLDVGQARSMLLSRPAGGYAKTEDIWSQPALQGLADSDAQAQAGVKTYWFDLDINVAMDGAALEQHTLLDASGQKPQILSRSWGDTA